MAWLYGLAKEGTHDMYAVQNQEENSYTPFKNTSSYQKTVLYIEDDPANIFLVEQIFERRRDLRLLTANSCHGGIMMAQDFHPDLIIMDIELPDLNGFDALKILRNDPKTHQVPIVALTSDAFPEQIEKGINAGFCNYITKPFKIDALMKALDEHLLYSPKNSI